MTLHRITINGWDGTETDLSMSEINRRVLADTTTRFPGADINEDGSAARRYAGDRFQVHVFSPGVAGRHNQALPDAHRYLQIDQAARTAIANADSLYADLSHNTTINWLAAHHRFVLAALEARRLLTDRIDAARTLLATAWGPADLDSTRSLGGLLYEQEIPAEHRIPRPDMDVVTLELAAFVELTTERFGILQATVTGGYPNGFTPATNPAPSPAEQTESAWAGEQWPASNTVANTARGW